MTDRSNYRNVVIIMSLTLRIDNDLTSSARQRRQSTLISIACRN